MKKHTYCISIRFILQAFFLLLPLPGLTRDGIIYLGPQQSTAMAAVSSATITSVVGSGLQGYAGDGDSALQAKLNVPQDVAFYLDGTLLISDFNNHRIRRYNPFDKTISTIAGNGINAATGNRLLATEAAISSPRALAVDSAGNVYISTLQQVRVITPDGLIDLYAGSTVGDSGDYVPARQAQFSTLGGLAIDNDGGLLIADILNNKIRKVRPDGIVITIAGSGVQGAAGDGGPATLAQLFSPVAVAVDPSGNIFIAERLGNRIRRINKDGIINTIYDSSINPQFSGPRGLAVYNDLFLYISSDDQRIRRMNLFDTTVEEVGGSGITGFSGDGGLAWDARFNYPVGIELDSNGNLLIADSANHVIREIFIPPHNVPATPTPSPTFSPTPTPTIQPTITPTRTPRPRTPTPTQTPVPTVTATATPTPLPQGQLAPDIPSGFSSSPNYLFFTGSTSVNVPFDPNSKKVKILLSSSADGTGALLTRDTIGLRVTHASGTISSSTITFTDLGKTRSPENITKLFEQGLNTVSVRLVDSKGSGYSTLALYVVVFSSPELADLPDIRTLVNESADQVYNLEDFIADRDTPIADIVWSVTAAKDGPSIQRDASNYLSVSAFNRPIETTFTVFASDGVFNVSEIVKMKVSSFRLNQFLLPDAPLLTDFAYVSDYSLLENTLDPPDANLADVPFETSFTAGNGIKSANVAHGEVFVFPEFPGGKVVAQVPVAIVGKRQSNTADRDGAVLYASSVFYPTGSNAEKTFDFSTTSLDDTQWYISKNGTSNGDVFLGEIPSEPVSAITDGWGAIFIVDPGETVSLLSQPIDIPPGPVKIAMWFAVEKLDGNDSDTPTITLALAEDSSNLSYTNVRGGEILGSSRYQYLCTTYDLIGSQAQALLQVNGSQNSGRAEIYVDNVRVYSSKRDIDLAIGSTRLPMQFDGTFETVLKGLGILVSMNTDVSYGSSAYITSGVNRTVVPGGFQQSLVLALNDPQSVAQVTIGPNAIDPSLYPRQISARAYVKVIKPGQGFFALGITNGNQEAVTFISNERLDQSGWNQVTATGLFSREGPIEPHIVLQNENVEGAFPGVIEDGANLAIDDITLQAFQDTPYLWDAKRLPAK